MESKESPLAVLPREIQAVIFHSMLSAADAARCRAVSNGFRNLIEGLPDMTWKLRYERHFGGPADYQRGWEPNTTWKVLYKRAISFVLNLKEFVRSRDLDSVPNDVTDEEAERFSLADLTTKLDEQNSRAVTDEQKSDFNRQLAARSYYAVTYGHHSLLKALLASGHVKQEDKKIDLLMLAIEQGWDPVAMLLFKEGMYNRDLMRTIHARTYLDAACEYDDTCGVAELLLQAGADPNTVSEVERPPLIKAVQTNAVNMINLLIRHGAEPKGHARLMDKPIHFVRSFDTLKLLLDLGATDSVFFKFRQRYSLLLALSESSETREMFKLLLDSGKGHNPTEVLAQAYKHNRAEIIALLEAKPDIKQAYDQSVGKV